MNKSETDKLSKELLSKEIISKEIISKEIKENNKILISNINTLFNNIKINKYLWISIIISIYILSNKRNKLFDYFTFVIVWFSGYIIHLISHKFDFEDLYDCIFENIFNKNTNTNNNTYINTIIRKIDNYIRIFLRYTFDFHSKIHHVSEINKKPLYVLLEVIQNILSQGGYILIFLILFKIKIISNNKTIDVNKYIIILWISIYLYIHHVFYNISNTKEHEIHHKNPEYNLDAVCIFDILLNNIPKPIPIPKKTPKPTPTPKKTPKPTPIPKKTPKPTPTPKKTPKPIPTPKKTPKPTKEKSQGGDTPSDTPSDTPTPTPISNQKNEVSIFILLITCVLYIIKNKKI
jgi:hypothetical protein